MLLRLIGIGATVATLGTAAPALANHDEPCAQGHVAYDTGYNGVDAQHNWLSPSDEAEYQRLANAYAQTGSRYLLDQALSRRDRLAQLRQWSAAQATLYVQPSYTVPAPVYVPPVRYVSPPIRYVAPRVRYFAPAPRVYVPAPRVIARSWHHGRGHGRWGR
jgi:hypothetical protein